MVDSLITKINTNIINPIIAFLFVFATAIFLWGIFEYVWGADNEEARKTGQQHMVWGVIGLFIMVGVVGLINLILGTFGAGSI
ncbi:hypothetical protein ACFLY7_02275 [Patescibacteria group bacterium]